MERQTAFRFAALIFIVTFCVFKFFVDQHTASVQHMCKNATHNVLNSCSCGRPPKEGSSDHEQRQPKVNGLNNSNGDDVIRIDVFGVSITDGKNVGPGSRYSDLLQKALTKGGFNARVENYAIPASGPDHFLLCGRVWARD